MSIQIVEIAQPSVIDTVAVAQPSTVALVEIRQGPAGDAGSGTNSITSATTSDGTANLSLSNVTTATATVTGTLTADHIHGNLAGNVYDHIRAGETLAKGDPVYVSGSHGSGSTLIPIVSKADASNAAKMPAVGIMDAAVANNASGHMVIVGTITELNTAAYSVNAELYVASGGGFTATPPSARAQPVARVERANANNGAVIVKVNGLSASDATASTLVRRDSSGGASFGALNTFTLTVTGGTTFGEESLVQFDALEYYYGDGAASAHRIALGAGTTGAELFGAATAAAARTTLGVRTFIKSADQSKTSDVTYAADSELAGIPLAAGKSYKIEFFIAAYVPTTEGGKARLSVPYSDISAIQAGYVTTTSWGNAQTSAIGVTNAATRFFTLVDAGGYNQNRALTGTAYTGTLASSGNLTLEWAQRTSGVNATIIRAGSTITVTEL